MKKEDSYKKENKDQPISLEKSIESAKKLILSKDGRIRQKAFLSLSRIYTLEEKAGAGLICAEEAEQINNDPETYIAKANALFENDEIDEAKKYFEAIFTLPKEPKNVIIFQANNGLGNCYQAQGNYEQAIREYFKTTQYNSQVNKLIQKNMIELENKSLEELIDIKTINDFEKKDHQKLRKMLIEYNQFEYRTIILTMMDATLNLTLLLGETPSGKQFMNELDKLDETYQSLTK